MPRMIRVYTGEDGKSHIAEVPFALQPFVDTEGAHGEGTPLQAATGITFRLSPPGYVLSWHCAPRRQYSVVLSGRRRLRWEMALSPASDQGCGAGRRPHGSGPYYPGVGQQPRFSAIVPLAEE